MSQYLEVARPVLEACLLDLGLTTPATFHTLYTQALRELRAEDFYGLWSYLAVCGITPDTTEGVGTYSPVTFG